MGIAKEGNSGSTVSHLDVELRVVVEWRGVKLLAEFEVVIAEELERRLSNIVGSSGRGETNCSRKKSRDNGGCV